MGKRRERNIGEMEPPANRDTKGHVVSARRSTNRKRTASYDDSAQVFKHPKTGAEPRTENCICDGRSGHTTSHHQTTVACGSRPRVQRPRRMADGTITDADLEAGVLGRRAKPRSFYKEKEVVLDGVKYRYDESRIDDLQAQMIGEELIVGVGFRTDLKAFEETIRSWRDNTEKDELLDRFYELAGARIVQENRHHLFLSVPQVEDLQMLAKQLRDSIDSNGGY